MKLYLLCLKFSIPIMFVSSDGKPGPGFEKAGFDFQKPGYPGRVFKNV